MTLFSYHLALFISIRIEKSIYIQKAVINLHSINDDGFVKNRTDTIFVIKAPHPVRGKLQPESSLLEGL